jgi:multiple sugar transport system substrate-binding protein
MRDLMSPLSRRGLLRLGGGTALAAILAACGGAASPTAAPAKPTDAQPAKPAGAAGAAATTAPAPGATTAPAAAGAATKPAAAGAATKSAAAAGASPFAGATAAPGAAGTPAAGAQPAAGGTMPQVVTNPAKAKGANLRILLWSNYKYDGIKSYANEFEQSYGAKLTFDPVASNDLPNKQIISLSGGTGEYDLTTVDEPFLPAYNPFLVELDPLIGADKFPKEDWVPVMWEAGTFNGKQFTMPFDPNVQILFYRKDILEQKGLKVPTKWTEYFEVAEKAQDDKVAGNVIMAKRDDQTGINAWNFMTTAGNEIFDDKFQPAFDNQKSYDALQLYKDIVDKVSPKGVIGYEYESVNADYRQGKAALLQQWASVAPGIKSSKDSVVADKTGFAPVLGQDKRHSMRGVWTWGISKDTKQKDAAWEFVKWFTTPDAMLKYIKAGSGNSPRLSVLQSEEFKKTFAHGEALAETFKIAKKRPIFKEYSEILQVLNILGSKVTTGEAKPKEAVQEATGKLGEIMKRGGYIR